MSYKQENNRSKIKLKILGIKGFEDGISRKNLEFI